MDSYDFEISPELAKMLQEYTKKYGVPTDKVIELAIAMYLFDIFCLKHEDSKNKVDVCLDQLTQIKSALYDEDVKKGFTKWLEWRDYNRFFFDDVFMKKIFKSWFMGD
jgi:hypothetical protein